MASSVGHMESSCGCVGRSHKEVLKAEYDVALAATDDAAYFMAVYGRYEYENENYYTYIFYGDSSFSEFDANGAKLDDLQDSMGDDGSIVYYPEAGSTSAVAVTNVTLDKITAQSITVGNEVVFTATVAPDNATDKKVKWSVGGTNAGAVTLYSDANCTQPVGADATATLSVYAKGISAGSATVTVTSNEDSNMSASCQVTVNAATYNVTVIAGNNMTKTQGSGSKSQTGLSGAMTAVAYTANDGYYFPTDYSVTAVNGISVARDSYTQITVSGTPTADAAITLTAPTAKTTPATPATAAATDCTTADNNDGKLTGVTADMEYRKSDAESWTAGTGSDITGLVPGTYYVRVKATDTTLTSDNQELTIKAVYTVNFDTHGGSTVAQQLIEAGEKATRPADPTKTGNFFGGWYTDGTFNIPYNFNQKVTGNTTIHARWGEHKVTWRVGDYVVEDVFTGTAPAADSNTYIPTVLQQAQPAGSTLSWKTETDASGNMTHTA